MDTFSLIFNLVAMMIETGAVVFYAVMSYKGYKETKERTKKRED